MGRTRIVGLFMVLGMVLQSSHFMSLFVFQQWRAYPRFDWSNPEIPSPPWSGHLVTLFGEDAKPFEGYPGAIPEQFRHAKGTVRGWRIPREGVGSCTLLYLHGEGGNIATDHRVRMYKILSTPPISCEVITIDYSGFGASDNYWNSEGGAIADVLSVLQSLKIDRQHLVIYGHSLGAGIAAAVLATMVELAPEFEQQGLGIVEYPKGFILESAFTSMDEAAVHCSEKYSPSFIHDYFQGAAEGTLQAHAFKTAENVLKIKDKVKMAVIHGRWDEIVPMQQGKRLAALGDSPMYTFDKGHTDILDDPDMVDALKKILTSWGLGTFLEFQ